MACFFDFITARAWVIGSALPATDMASNDAISLVLVATTPGVLLKDYFSCSDMAAAFSILPSQSTTSLWWRIVGKNRDYRKFETGYCACLLLELLELIVLSLARIECLSFYHLDPVLPLQRVTS